MDKFEQIESKLYKTKEELASKLAFWRFKGYRIVFTNGCFDILHTGHVKYLAKAANLGDILIIGLNTDNSVKKLKGESRPVNDEIARSLVLGASFFVNAIVLFEEDTPYDLIKFIQPNVLVKGSDYNKEDIVGFDIVTSRGGDVVTIDFLDGFSTTNIISKLSK